MTLSQINRPYQNVGQLAKAVEYTDTKQSDGEAPVLPVLWGMRRTPSLLSLPGPHRPGVVAPDKALSMG